MTPRFSASGKNWSPRGRGLPGQKGRTRQAGLATEYAQGLDREHLLPPWAILCLSAPPPSPRPAFLMHLSLGLFQMLLSRGAKTLGSQSGWEKVSSGEEAGWSQRNWLYTDFVFAYTLLCARSWVSPPRAPPLLARPGGAVGSFRDGWQSTRGPTGVLQRVSGI